MEKTKLCLVGMFVLLLWGCSTIGTGALSLLAGSASKGIEADAELTVGKKEETTDVDTQIGDRMGDETFEAQTINIANQHVPTLYVVLMVLLAGWAIPSPGAMFIGVATGIRDFFSILIRGKRGG